MTHDDLVEIGRKWCLKPWSNKQGWSRGSCSLVLTEIVTGCSETPDVLGWHGDFSILLEAKTSRSDFQKDKKKHFRAHPELGLGNNRYFITPKGLVSVDEVPEGWGLIEVTPRGGTRVVKPSDFFESRKKSEVTILLSLIRRLKIDPGKHVSIRSYTIEKETEPKATMTQQCPEEGEDLG